MNQVESETHDQHRKSSDDPKEPKDVQVPQNESRPRGFERRKKEKKENGEERQNGKKSFDDHRLLSECGDSGSDETDEKSQRKSQQCVAHDQHPFVFLTSSKVKGK